MRVYLIVFVWTSAGFQCQSTPLKGKVFLIGKCASPNKATSGDSKGEPKLDACAALLNEDGTSAWGKDKYFIRTAKAPGTYSFLNGGVEAKDGSYLLVFGHTDNVRTIIKLDPSGV